VRVIASVKTTNRRTRGHLAVAGLIISLEQKIRLGHLCAASVSNDFGFLLPIL